MIDRMRGPYQAIRWFCADGTVLPPTPYACREHGGGRQHAEYSPERARLAELGWHVGTIFAALEPGSLLASGSRNPRLRELPLERYLMDIDDGWVLRKARNYRGRVQIENETAAGRQLLLTMLARRDWAAVNYLLVRELVRTVPHGEDTDLSRHVRRAAVELAEREPRAEPWRAEIHSAPSLDTAARLRRWANTLSDAETRRMAETLADDLDLLYGAEGRQAHLEEQLSKLSGVAKDEWRDSVHAALAAPLAERVDGLCAAVHEARASVLPASTPPAQLKVLDTLQGLETEVRLASGELLSAGGLSRAAYLSLADDLLDCTFGAGLLSANELESLRVHHSPEDGAIALGEYRRAITQLRRVPGWAAGGIRYAFAEPLIRYTALDPRAGRFSDDLLRGSTAWVLGDVLRVLNTDVGRLTGTRTELAGVSTSAAVALNPGFAAGTLRIFETLEAADSATLSPADVVVLPETLAELSPVAGILTLGEGNALSHVQLLARNFGIPNVAIDGSALDLLRPLQGQAVVLIAGSDGTVALDRREDVSALEPLLSMPGGSVEEEARITVPAPDLARVEPLPLATLERSLSGRVVGPKAANLGELNRLFPGRVAPALALPFGVYAAHVDAADIRTRLKETYDAYRSDELDEDGFAGSMQALRAEIGALTLHEETRARLSEAMQAEFGDPGSYGIFIRSDTNVEDLPEFTGAGLSETLPHVIGLDAQFRGIPRVWSSVLSPRAIAWRSNLLTNPEQVFASVLLMRSVPSDKSGVLVTANVSEPGSDGLTVSTAWGIGGAVAGEAAETLVVLEQGTWLVSEAKTPYRRRLSPEGGISWEPAASGQVLAADEIQALRELAAQAVKRYEPVLDSRGTPRPWDIEFGFVDGELTLFQIRPLVERGALRADRAVELLFADSGTERMAGETVDLSLAPLTRDEPE